MTREQIIERFPRASEAFIKANLGNNGTPASVKQSTIMADAFEKQLRNVAVATVKDMGTVFGSQKQGEAIVNAIVEYGKSKAVQPQFSTSKAWVTIGGKRFYAKSLWEQNYAHYLEFLKSQGNIMDWEYEPETFWFEGIRRGTNNYKPDFRVTHNDGSIEYREVKGFFDKKSKTKIRRMKKYHPKVPIKVLGEKWWKKHGPGLAMIVPGWRKKSSKKSLQT